MYTVAKDFYQLGAYSRALVCLQQYVQLPGATLIGTVWLSRPAPAGVLFAEYWGGGAGAEGVQEVCAGGLCGRLAACG